MLKHHFAIKKRPPTFLTCIDGSIKGSHVQRPPELIVKPGGPGGPNPTERTDRTLEFTMIDTKDLPSRERSHIPSSWALLKMMIFRLSQGGIWTYSLEGREVRDVLLPRSESTTTKFHETICSLTIVMAPKLTARQPYRVIGTLFIDVYPIKTECQHDHQPKIHDWSQELY